MAIVRIPPVLRPSVGGEKELSASGSSVGEVLRTVAESHPDTQSQLFSADGGLNRYVNVYLNDEDVRVLDGLETEVGSTDTLVILPAMAGGPADPAPPRAVRRAGDRRPSRLRGRCAGRARDRQVVHAWRRKERARRQQGR